jgi:hypothetical protein
MKKAIFLHGYGGEPIEYLINVFDEIGWDIYQPFVNYDLEWDVDRCKSITNNIINQAKECDLIIGLSLGGYTAHLVANQLNKNCILINPGLDREKSSVFLGNQFPIEGDNDVDTKEFDFPSKLNNCELEVYLGGKDFQIPNHYTTDYIENNNIKCEIHNIPNMYHIFNLNEIKEIIKITKFI